MFVFVVMMLCGLYCCCCHLLLLFVYVCLQHLKMNIIKAGLVDVINYVLIRSSSWSPEQAANPDVRPTSISWTAELCNATGMLRNVSSAGEEARLSLRSARSLVDALLWIMRGAIGTDEASNKVCVCVCVCVCVRARVGVDVCVWACPCV